MRKNVFLALAILVAVSTVSSATMLREIWWQSLGIDDAVALATGDTAPDQVDILADSAWVDIADNYVAKLSGYVVVPATGDYNFYVASDDYSRLYVSQDTDMANAVQVAFVDGWTGAQSWDSYDSQKAETMSLTEGQVMAVYAIMQEGTGGDNLAIGWTGPGIDSISLLGANATHLAFKAGIVAPANGATGVIDATAEWIAPALVESPVYNVYGGTDPEGLDLLAEGITETSLPYGSAGAELDFGTTYYWRVDTVGQEPGDVWSFTTEPETFLVQNIIATSNGTPQEGSGPEKTVDGSGLNEDGTVSQETTDQWLAAPPEGEALWIQFELPRVYKLVDMTVWNSNTQFEAMLGYGAKNVTVEYSIDGVDWMAFGDIELPQADVTTIELAGIGAKYIRMMINANYGGMFPDSGLSEVQLTYVPAHPRLVAPADGATGVNPAAVLDWYAGRGSVSSDVTINGELVATVEESSFAPELIYGLPYTWSVAEFDGTDVWEGDVWTFTTPEFVAVASDTLVYDEAGNTLEVAMDGADLTAYAPDTLRVSYTGNPIGFAEEDGVVTIGASGSDIWGAADEFRYVYKTLTGDGSITARVDSIDNIVNNWAKAGVMVRQSTDAGSQHSMTVITGDFASPGSAGNGASFQGRQVANTDSVNNDAASSIAPPYYVQVVREGNNISGFISADGVEWLQLGEAREVVMEDPILIGLAVTSHDTGSTVLAQLSDISTTGEVTGEWTAEAIGANMPSNDAADLYVAVEDGAGAVATVLVGDPAATQAVTTQYLNVPLADLAVDLTDVAKITVGAGTPDAPAAGSGVVDVSISVGTPLSHNVMGDITGPDDVVQGVPNDEDWPAAEYPALAVDNDTATKFLHFKGGSQPTGIQVAPAVGPSVVTGVAFTTANDDYGRDPTSFELYGSNESIDGPYELIASGAIADFAGEELWPRFTKTETPIEFENEVAYTYYQILFPTVDRANNDGLMQIAEVELIGVSSY